MELWSSKPGGPFRNHLAQKLRSCRCEGIFPVAASPPITVAPTHLTRHHRDPQCSRTAGYPLPDQLQRANDAGRRRSLLEGIKSPIERALLEDPELGSTVDSESDVEWEDVYDRADCHRVRASDSPDYERAPPGEDGAAPPLRFDDQGNLLADERPVYGTSGDGAPRRSMVRDSVRRWLARRGTSTSNS